MADSQKTTGFGNQTTNRLGRMLRPDGDFAVHRLGSDWSAFNPYHWLVNLSWLSFFVVIFAFYTVINLVFTFAYLIIGVEFLSNNGAIFPFWQDFWHAFFFSTQTFTTVGYGGFTPLNFATSLVASIEALAGIMSAALMSGLFFARFSRATSSVAFSRNAIVAPYEGGLALMWRTVNRRNNNMSKLSVKATLSYLVIDEKGVEKRDFDELKLETSRVEMFPLNWTMVHPIDYQSPLFNKTTADWEQMDVEVLITMAGYDDTFAQVVHTRHSYKWFEIKHGFKFVPMYYQRPDGMTVLELTKLNDMKAV